MVRVGQLAQVSAADVGARAIRRIRRRLIPFLALLYSSSPTSIASTSASRLCR